LGGGEGEGGGGEGGGSVGCGGGGVKKRFSYVTSTASRTGWV
jgi:hypothetical protein